MSSFRSDTTLIVDIHYFKITSATVYCIYVYIMYNVIENINYTPR